MAVHVHIHRHRARDESEALQKRRSEIAHLRARAKEAKDNGDKKMAEMFERKASNLESSMPKSTDRGRDADREPNQSDLNTAARAFNMVGMSPLDLEDLIRETQGKPVFASKVVYLAAKQILAVKRRNGARDGGSTYGGYGTGGRADEVKSSTTRSAGSYKWVVKVCGTEADSGTAPTQQEADTQRQQAHKRVERNWVRNGVVE